MLANIRKVASLGVLATGLTTLRAVLVLPLLGPEQLGIWKTVMLLMPAIGLLRLAISTGMVLRVPFYLGAGDNRQAARLTTAAGLAQVGNGLVFALGTACAALWVSDPRRRVALLAMAAVLLLSQLHNYLRDVIIAHRDFDVRSRGLLLAALCDCVFSLALASRFGLAGLGIGTAIGFAVPAWYLWRNLPQLARPRWDPPAWRELWITGWSSAAADTGAVLLRYVDVAMLAALAPPQLVGLYALSQMILDLSVHLTRISLGEVVAPELTHLSSRAPLREVAGALRRPLRLVSLALPPCLLLGALLLPYAVGAFLPAYSQGVNAATIMLLSTFFVALQAIVQPYLALAGRTISLARLTLLLLPVLTLAQFTAWKAGLGLAGVAALSVLSSAALSVASLFWAGRAEGLSRSGAVRQLVAIFIAPLRPWLAAPHAPAPPNNLNALPAAHAPFPPAPRPYQRTFTG